MTNRHRAPARRPVMPESQRVTARDLVAMTTAIAGAVAAIAGAVTAIANHPQLLEEALKWIEKLSR